MPWPSALVLFDGIVLDKLGGGWVRLMDVRTGGGSAILGDMVAFRRLDAPVLDPVSSNKAFTQANTAEEGSAHYLRSVDDARHRLEIWCCSNPACRGAAGVSLDTVLFKCSRCENAQYCSKDCQTAHWRQQHRRLCPELKARLEAQKARLDLPEGRTLRLSPSPRHSTRYTVPNPEVENGVLAIQIMSSSTTSIPFE
jgi:hypothetical protein